jgi:hypothetical protein
MGARGALVTPRRILSLTAVGTALLVAAPALAALPQVDYSLAGPSGDNGWYVGPVTVKWTLSGEQSSSGCDTQTLTAETPGTQVTCTASNASGPTTGTTAPIRIDQTVPTDIAAAASRAPDAGAWFTAPVDITWSGSDALSGIASCTALSYAGPDGSAAAPTGSCRDQAGNTGAPVAFSLDYDATPPALDAVTATAGPLRAGIRWTAGADAIRATVVREPAGAGAAAKTVADVPAATGAATDTALAPTTTYTWTITVLDAAGNATSRRVTARTAPMQLRWHSVRGASYYNVQVFRGARKVLSAWPATPSFRLGAAWRYLGRAERLVAGKYRWYAWAGFGPRSARRYGRLLAQGSFTVPPKTG